MSFLEPLIVQKHLLLPYTHRHIYHYFTVPTNAHFIHFKSTKMLY